MKRFNKIKQTNIIPKRNNISLSAVRISNTKPEFNYIETNGSNKIITCGLDNNYYRYLENICNNSATLSSILQTKKLIAGGQGFDTTNLSDQAKNFLSNEFGNETTDDILLKMVGDYVNFGGASLAITWSEDRSIISKIEYLKYTKVRYADPNYMETSNTVIPNLVYYYVSENWQQIQQYKPVRYQAFDAKYKEIEGEFSGEATQLLVIHNDNISSTDNYYTLPDWIPCKNWALIEGRVSDFHLNNLDNNFTASVHINIDSAFDTDEQRDEIVKGIKDNYEGAKNAGATFITTSDGANQQNVTLTPIAQNNNHELYIHIMETARDQIIVANKITDPNLLGIRTPGSLSSSDKSILKSLAVYQATVINPIQIRFEAVFTSLFNINGLADEAVIEKYQILFDPEYDINMVIAIITNDQLSSDQKLALLISMGYQRNEAESLIK